MDSSKEKNKIKTLEELKDSENHASILETKKNIEDGTDKEEVSYSNGMTHMYWLPIGIALGTAMGVSTSRLSLWLSLGIILGLLLSFLSRKN